MSELPDYSVIYISGPMSGYPDANRPAFFAAQDRLQRAYSGHEHCFINPAQLDAYEPLGEGATWYQYLRRDIPHLVKCTAIVVIEGWRQSRGAQLEVYIGRALGMPIFEERKGAMHLPEETCLQEAQRLVYGDRGEDYGHPLLDYTKTADLLNVVLHSKLTEPLEAEDVIMAMICVKISREINRPKRDNRVDMAGYAECLNRCRELSPADREEMIQQVRRTQQGE